MRELYKDTIAISRFRIDETLELTAVVYGGIVLFVVFEWSIRYLYSITVNNLLNDFVFNY